MFVPEFLGRTEVRIADILWATQNSNGPIIKRLLLHLVKTGEIILKLDLRLFNKVLWTVVRVLKFTSLLHDFDMFLVQELWEVPLYLCCENAYIYRQFRVQHIPCYKLDIQFWNWSFVSVYLWCVVISVKRNQSWHLICNILQTVYLTTET